MPDQLPFVSVIVLTLNGATVIRECLESLSQNDYPNFETLVVNNGSTDGTPEIVAKEFPRVRLINLPYNKGFAGGMNEGIKASRGSIVIPLNDDTISTPTVVRKIVEPLIEEPTVGIVGCKILYPDRKTIQHAGAYILADGFTRHYGYQELDQGQCDQKRDVDYVTGCMLAIRRKLFEQLGLFDDRFFPTYYEETEFAVRARKAGYRVVYNPEAVLYHLESKTEIAGSQRFLYRYHKSRWRFILKNFSVYELLRACKHELRFLKRMNWKIEGRPLLHAYFSTLIRLPLIVYDRFYRHLPLEPLELEESAAKPEHPNA